MKQKSLLLMVMLLISCASSTVQAQQKIPETNVINNPDGYFVIAEDSSLVLDAIGWRLTRAGRDVMADFLTDLRIGLDKAGSSLEPGASLAEIKEAVRATADFIRRRSEVVLDDAQVEKLISMESEFLAGKRRGMTTGSIAHVVIGTLFERIDRLTDQEISQAANSFRVASIDDSAEVIAFRMNGSPAQVLKADDFIIQAKAFRDSSTPLARLQRTMAENLVREEVEWRVNLFARSYTEKWGDATTSGVSPLKSLLVAYSVMSGDTCFSDAALRGTMQALANAMRKNNKKESGAEARAAFGARGFIYSTPLDLFLNPFGVNRFLDRLDLESRR